MADHSLANTSCTTDSSQATGSRTSSVSLSGFANRTLSSETSATAMARFSLDLRDLEAASALGALGVIPETQWPTTEAIMHELSTDSEVTFRRVLGSAEVLSTRPAVDPLEVNRSLLDLSRSLQSPMAASPSVIARPGMQPPAASYVFGHKPDIWSTLDQTTPQPQTLQTITLRNVGKVNVDITLNKR